MAIGFRKVNLDRSQPPERGASYGRLWFTLILIGALGVLLVAVMRGCQSEGEGVGGKGAMGPDAEGVQRPPLQGRQGALVSPPLGALAPTLPKAAGFAESGVGAAAREERVLISRLRHQGAIPEGGEHLARQELMLDPELLSHVADASNWMPELMKASSSILPRGDGEPTLLSLDRLAADSILWELGLREGDVIALIDGEIPHFSPTRALDYIRKAEKVMVALERGEPASLTILRQGQPLHLVFHCW